MFTSAVFRAIAAFAGVAAALPASAGTQAPTKYLVSLKESADVELEMHTQWVTEVHKRNLARRDDLSTGVEKTFSFPGFHGYAGTFDSETLEMIRTNPNVSAIEEEVVVSIASIVSQQNPPWGLSAISNANPPSSSAPYHYDDSAGEDTFIYVIDSGILIEHEDFEGRAERGWSTGEATDRRHGTYVASIAAGRQWGVAKKATIIDVQGLGSSVGTSSGVLGAVNFVANDIAAKNRARRAVVNMSLSANGVSSVMVEAIRALVNAGVTVVAAAGNSGVDVGNLWPASMPEVITVAATSSNYRRWQPSNYGSAVDLFAPGDLIPGAGSDSTTATYMNSGTSMAAPHVAGVVAYLTVLEGYRTPAQTDARLKELALRNVVTDPRGSANLFLYNGVGR